MKFLVEEIMQAEYSLTKLRDLVPRVAELPPGSPVRLFFARAHRMGICLEKIPTFLDQNPRLCGRRIDAEVEFQEYQSRLEEARNFCV